MLRVALVSIAAACLLGTQQTHAKQLPTLPHEVYIDFSADGRIDGDYPTSVLNEVVTNATLNQYGDPLMMLRLRRAAAQRIAGGDAAPTQSPADTVEPLVDTTTLLLVGGAVVSALLALGFARRRARRGNRNGFGGRP